MLSVPNYASTICTPVDVDVLCGKTSTNCHPGNVYFRELVLSKVDDYMSASKKCQKGEVVLEIMTTLEAMGTRFLKLDKHSNEWHVIKPSEAREKVSHSIRDRVRDRKNGKVIIPSQEILSSPPEFSTKEAVLSSKNNKKKPKKSAKSKVFSKKNFVVKPSLRRIKVVSGGQDLATLEEVLRPISAVSDDDSEVFSSSPTSAPADDISISCSVSCSIASSDHDSVISEYLGCGDVTQSPKPYPISLPFKSGFADYPSSISTPVGAVVAYMDSCELSVSEDDFLSNPLEVSIDNDFEDDESAFLDDYNDLFKSDISTDQDESDFVVSMLQEACAVRFD